MTSSDDSFNTADDFYNTVAWHVDEQVRLNEINIAYVQGVSRDKLNKAWKNLAFKRAVRTVAKDNKLTMKKIREIYFMGIPNEKDQVT